MKWVMCRQKEQQQQCLRLTLELTQCPDRLVVSAAVRALGVLVLYPCLSQVRVAL